MSAHKNVWDIISTSYSFKTFCSAAKATGFDQVLKGEGPFTIFVPVEDAFKKYPKFEAIVKDKERLAELVKYHTVSGRLKLSNLDTRKYATLSGKDFTVTVTTFKMINSVSRIVEGNLEGSNGVVHLIETVLVSDPLFSVVSAEPQLSRLSELLKISELEKTLSLDGSYTFFAPTNSALSKMGNRLEELVNNKEKLVHFLKYHLLPTVSKKENMLKDNYYETLAGARVHLETKRGLLLNGLTKFVSNDSQSSNGVYHEINFPLVPQSVAEASRSHGELNKFFEAIQVTGLYNELNNTDKDFTVFAPNDDAFSKWKSFDKLKSADLDELRRILRYHIIPRRISETELEEQKYATSLDGREFELLMMRRFTINGYAEVVQTDIMAVNGVIHVIDHLLFYNTVSSFISPSSNLSIFNDLMKAANLSPCLSSYPAQTYYVPTNEAFSKMDKKALNDLFLPENNGKCLNVLKPHIFGGVDRTWTLKEEKPESFRCIDTRSVKYYFDGDSIKLDTAEIIDGDNLTSNGVVHVVNAIIIPVPPLNKK